MSLCPGRERKVGKRDRVKASLGRVRNPKIERWIHSGAGKVTIVCGVGAPVRVQGQLSDQNRDIAERKRVVSREVIQNGAWNWRRSLGTREEPSSASAQPCNLNSHVVLLGILSSQVASQFHSEAWSIQGLLPGERGERSALVFAIEEVLPVPYSAGSCFWL